MVENKMDLILNSAEELMYKMSEPKKEITVDMIARNAGIGKGSIYYYFKSKDEIIDAVIERCYKYAVNEYFSEVGEGTDTFDKLRLLFGSIMRDTFIDKSRNVLLALHLQGDIVMHYKLKMIAIKTVAPILSRILEEGCRLGVIKAEDPQEGAEMMIAMLTFLLDTSENKADKSATAGKLKLYARVLETCLYAEHGSFDFLFKAIDQGGSL